ncbi:Expansin-A23 -like protein [Tripterygium wilfordii]|uniref:Expansin n=1 Tax=Tripterygium wilfordii TaxID=458696 RepID=A0A7J7DS10_TRIWF|nr:expansin-A23-like [Tripterygium wilfordii]KAF5748934.1 Expansin-A23 -like protein [Tripterygium wilfordii]
MATSRNLATVLFMFMALNIFVKSMSNPIEVEYGAGAWSNAHATFYGDMKGVGTMQGACGYGDLFKQGYGLETTALSYALFNNGATCGACYEIKCVNDPQWCYPQAGSITVTATNSCPPSATPPQWCNPPNQHFDLSMPMFVKLANYKAGIIPVQYRRVACVKKGGIEYELSGNPYNIEVLVFNVGGAGDVKSVSIKGSSGGWSSMNRDWGQRWVTKNQLVGQSLSFQVTTSDGKMVTEYNVVPAGWQFGQTYQGKINF